MWSNWYCPKCGGPLTTATHEQAKPLVGKNVLVQVINDTKHDIVLDIPPHDRVRLEPYASRGIPSAMDQNVLIRVKEDGTILVGTKMYQEGKLV